MAQQWKTVYNELPPNGAIVWIRVNAIYGELALAEFVSIKKEFKTTITLVQIPIYVVARWKFQ